MNVSKLIEEYKRNNPEGHFFDKESLAFFGERISDMKIMKDKTIIEDGINEVHECYVLSTYQRKHPLGARRAYHYFDCTTFNHVVV